MAKQIYEKISVPCEDLEWLYVPNVEYADYGDCKRSLQLIVPYRSQWEGDERYPLVLFVPGSAWYKQEMYNSLPAYARLAERGYVTAVVQYRESTIAPYPAQVQDLKAAVRFLVQKAQAFHIDTERIYLAGNSSGAHIALLTVLTKAHNRLDSPLYPETDYSVRGIIAESAPSDMFLCAAKPIPEWMPEDFQPVRDLLGGKQIEESAELAEAASCKTYISKDVALPPILLLHGSEDDQVEVRQSRCLFEQLSKADKEVSFYEMEGCGHGGTAFWSKEILDILDGFMKSACGEAGKINRMERTS